jgi:hypothetical protein
MLAASAPLEPLPSGCPYGAAGYRAEPAPNPSRRRSAAVESCLSPPASGDRYRDDPDPVESFGQSMPASAKHILRLRPTSGAVNSFFPAKCISAPSQPSCGNARKQTQCLGSIVRRRNIFSRARSICRRPNRSRQGLGSRDLRSHRAAAQRRSASRLGPAAGTVAAAMRLRRAMNQFGAGARPPLTTTVAVMPAISGTSGGTRSMRIRTGTR